MTTKGKHRNPDSETIKKRIKELEKDGRETDKKISNMIKQDNRFEKMLNDRTCLNSCYNPDDVVYMEFFKLIKYNHWIKYHALNIWNNKLEFNKLCEKHGHEYSKASIKKMMQGFPIKELPKKYERFELTHWEVQMRVLALLDEIESCGVTEMQKLVHVGWKKLVKALDELRGRKQIEIKTINSKSKYFLTKYPLDFTLIPNPFEYIE